jgi:DivIVA domain-containing protein
MNALCNFSPFAKEGDKVLAASLSAHSLTYRRYPSPAYTPDNEHEGSVRQTMFDAHEGHNHKPHGMAEVTSEAAYAVRTAPQPYGGGWLTAVQVRNQVFSTVRLREGYEMGEVDTFLDQVENTLGAVLADNQDLRTQLTVADRAAAQATQLNQELRAQLTLAERAAERAAAQVAHPGGDVARIVALAQQAADQAITAAQAEAATIVARARERAEVVVQEALDHGTHMRESLEAQAGQLQGLLRELDAHDGALLTLLQPQPGAAESTATRPLPADPPLVPERPTP